MEFDKSAEQWYPVYKDDIAVFKCPYCGVEITASSSCCEIDGIVFCDTWCLGRHYHEQLDEYIEENTKIIDFARMS